MGVAVQELARRKSGVTKRDLQIQGHAYVTRRDSDIAPRLVLNLDIQPLKPGRGDPFDDIMPLPTRKKHRGQSRQLLLAFDIGTTFSGISYSILDPGKVPEIRPVTRYPSQEQVGGDSKIPTVIYYDSNGKTHAIGAETLKEGIEADAEENGWRKARWFKLHMRPKKTRAGLIRPQEEEIPPLPLNKTVIEIFADFMAYLNECAKAYITETHGEKLWESLQDDILYVLTHPNGWAGPQQGEMRRAAIVAGLIPDTEEGASRVTFVTEGEASLHFCLSNGLNVPEDDDDEPSGVLIVDAGGGTIDLTSYRKLPNGTFTEIAVPQCYFHGGAYVTMRAQKYFEELLDGTRYSADVDTLTTRFDRNTKHVFKREDEPHHIQFASARERDSTLGIRGGRLTLEGATVAKFFEPSVKCIVDAVKEQHTNSRHPIKTVFLVGGFSASQWLYEKVKDAIEPLGVTVSRPDTHVNKAVSNGAVSYYVDGAVSTRVSRSTYGASIYVVYDPKKAEHRKRGRHIEVHDVTGEPVLYDFFSTILPVGTTVETTQEFRESFSCSATDPDSIILQRRRIKILSYVGKSAPLWIDDKPNEYQVMCIVEADTTKVTREAHTDEGGASYYDISYDIVLQFGLTELRAHIAYEEDGVEKRGPATVIYD